VGERSLQGLDTDSPALIARKLRDLNLVAPDGSAAYVSAASGLVASGDELYVIGDDERHLACFAASGEQPGSLLRLFDGELPDEAGARKRAKDDLEILLKIPVLPGFASGALLALGSGSRPNRMRGALIPLDDNGRVRGDAVPIDATPLYQSLLRECGALNLEGCWLQQRRLRFLQRGNQGRRNSIIDLDFDVLATALAHEHVLADVKPARILEVDLGAIEGVRLGFTDACGLPDGRWLFSAVAEDTADAYADGGFVGAVVGCATADAGILWQRRLLPPLKVEGIHVRVDGAGLRILCVTDADDRQAPAQLLQASVIPGGVA
jgi:hypothetical protein